MKESKKDIFDWGEDLVDEQKPKKEFLQPLARPVRRGDFLPKLNKTIIKRMRDGERAGSAITEKSVNECVDVLTKYHEMLELGHMADDVLMATGHQHLIPSFYAGISGKEGPDGALEIEPNDTLRAITRSFQDFIYRIARQEMVHLITEPPTDREAAVVYMTRLKIAQAALAMKDPIAQNRPYKQ